MNNISHKTLFFGTPAFAVPVLESLITLPNIKIQAVVTQPDKPVGRKQVLTPPAVKKAALQYGLPVWQAEKITTEEFEEQLKQWSPDIIMVAAYGKIIPKNLLSLPKYGWLNVHASHLPKYRGASPIQAAILNGDEETGVTLMKINAGLDTGPIIAQKAINIQPADDWQALHDKLSRLGAKLVTETLPDYLAGKLSAVPQDNSKASTTKIIRKEDGRIDWQKPAEAIDRQIRAYTPWPGAYCFWSGNTRSEQKELSNSNIELRLKIIEASVAKDNVQLTPGQTRQTNQTLLVGCGQGNLELKKIQMEAKNQQTITEFLKGYPEFNQTILA